MENNQFINNENKNEEELNDAMDDETLEQLLEAIESGATLKDLRGLPDNVMDDVYSLAYDFYNLGRLNDAESLFRFLCIHDFYNSEYPLALAAVYQLKKNYHKAFDFYALAYSLNYDDLRPMFYAGQCHLMLKRKNQAKKCFKIVCKSSKDEELIEQAKLYLDALSENIPEDKVVKKQ